MIPYREWIESDAFYRMRIRMIQEGRELDAKAVQVALRVAFDSMRDHLTATDLEELNK